MDEPEKDDVDAICHALMGDDQDAYRRALQSLNRRPHLFRMAKPAILKAMAGASGAQRFDLAFALASLGSRDAKVMESMAGTSASLDAFGALELFDELSRVDRVRATAGSPIKGDIVVDRMGNPFLSPAQQHRGRGMAAIRLVGWSHDASGHRRGAAVAVTGFFKAGVGLLIQEIRAAGL